MLQALTSRKPFSTGNDSGRRRTDWKLQTQTSQFPLFHLVDTVEEQFAPLLQAQTRESPFSTLIMVVGLDVQKLVANSNEQTSPFPLKSFPCMHQPPTTLQTQARESPFSTAGEATGQCRNASVANSSERKPP